jgi:hypothetical protein
MLSLTVYKLNVQKCQFEKITIKKEEDSMEYQSLSIHLQAFHHSKDP